MRLNATLLVQEADPITVATERLGRSDPAYNMPTYQHLPGMQAEAAAAFEQILQKTRRS
jgi:hypothetical protein